jgi:two-component system LytT family sensor kinase
MHPALKTFVVCVLIGVSFGSFLYFNYDHRPVRIAISLLSSLNIGSLMMLAIYQRHYFTGVTIYQGIKVLIMIVLLVAAALLGTEITLWMQSLLTSASYQPLDGGSTYILNILVALVAGIPMYVSEEWKTSANSKLINQQYRLLQMEQQNTLFELELLRAKINPHFLYNVHNTIAGLITKDPTKAEELVLLLSKFFRFTLDKGSATFYTVNDELDIIKTYLHMQQIRHERMIYTINAAPETLNLHIPSFILQPLVENAVKHGIEPSAANGYIEVNITLVEGDMVITVADSGPAFADTPCNGMGLQMVTNKLKLLYGSGYKLELINTPQKHVGLTLPKRS